MITLGDIYSAAAGELRAAAAVPLTPDPDALSTRTRDLGVLLAALQRGPGTVPGDPVRLANRGSTVLGGDLAGHLYHAAESVRQAQLYQPTPGAVGPDPVGTRLQEATRHVGIAHDLLDTHRTPDGGPRTPYAYVLATRPARDYLLTRTAELLSIASTVPQHLSRTVEHPGARNLLEQARAHLHQAATLGRNDARTPLAALAALPLVPPLTVDARTVTDPRTLPELIRADTEKLSRLAFSAKHPNQDTEDGRLSGADLRNIANWQATSNLLTGRLLLHCAEHQSDAPWAADLRTTADHLRTSSVNWTESAMSWRRVVDLGDPRSHPRLRPVPYEQVRRGHTFKIPRTRPHSGVHIAHSMALRTGQFLFGLQWSTRDEKSPAPRPAAEILDEVGGPAELIGLLRRIPETSRQLGIAASEALNRALPDLVTDDIDLRAPGGNHAHQFYPVHPRQADALNEHYVQASQAAREATRTLNRAGTQAGTPTARADLDLAAQRFSTLPPQHQKTTTATPSPAARDAVTLAAMPHTRAPSTTPRTGPPAPKATPGFPAPSQRQGKIKGAER